MKSIVSSILRGLGVLTMADKARFLLNKTLYTRKNQNFIRRNPGLSLPPEYLVYESYRLDYEAYFEDGQESAKWLVQELSAFVPLSHLRILDWGCGPARLVRHLPLMIGPSNEVYGTDYNERTIEWCRRHIQGVQFSLNDINPPLRFNGEYFDIVYGISIFTHLSRDNHYKWLEELYRVLKTNGILLITTQGAAFQPVLTEKEKELFAAGELVERAKVKEGHRLFSAFHPTLFMQALFAGRWKVLRFTPGQRQHWGTEQDTWILQKVG